MRVFGVSPCIALLYCYTFTVVAQWAWIKRIIRQQQHLFDSDDVASEKKFLKRHRYKNSILWWSNTSVFERATFMYYIRVKFITYTYLRNDEEKKVVKISHAKWPRPVTSRALHARVHSAVHLPSYNNTCTAFDYEIWKLFYRNGL